MVKHRAHIAARQPERIITRPVAVPVHPEVERVDAETLGGPGRDWRPAGAALTERVRSIGGASGAPMTWYARRTRPAVTVAAVLTAATLQHGWPAGRSFWVVGPQFDLEEQPYRIRSGR